MTSLYLEQFHSITPGKPGVMLLLFLTMASVLCTMTREVANDGTCPYLLVQMAINDAVDGDTILVHPGRYLENLDFQQKNLTLGSLFLTTGDRQYRVTTIIDGHGTGTVIKADNVEAGLIAGITITGGYGIGDHNGYSVPGGIEIYQSAITLDNNIICHNFGQSCGGMLIGISSVSLSGNSISDNHSSVSGGGFVAFSSALTFDTQVLNSIYANSATRGNDLWLNNIPDCSVVVDTFSVLEPDVFFICSRGTTTYTFSAQHQYYEPVESDLWVSPNGSDANSGLSVDEPLRFVHTALAKIVADSLNPRTIHLAAGTYSVATTGEPLAMTCRSWVTIAGAGSDQTTIDSEGDYGNFNVWSGERGFTLRGMTFINGYDWGFMGSGIWIYYYSSCSMDDIVVDNVHGQQDPESWSAQFSTVDVHNLTIQNARGERPIRAVNGSLYIDRIRLHHNRPGGEEGFGGLFGFANMTSCTIKNLLAYSNSSNFQWDLSGMGGLSHGKVTIINATIAMNHCGGSGVSLGQLCVGEDGELDLYNTIVWGNNPHEIVLTSNSVGNPTHLVVSHCLIKDGQEGVYYHNNGANFVNWLDGNLSDDPCFTVEDENNPYNITPGSPCVDAGTSVLPDTLSLPATDILGNPRIFGRGVDIGAYECQEVSIDAQPMIPEPIGLSIYPNPIRGNGILRLDLPCHGQVELTIYNVRGQKVKSILKAECNPGTYELRWDGTDQEGHRVASGQYMAKVSLSETVICKKVMIVK